MHHVWSILQYENFQRIFLEVIRSLEINSFSQKPETTGKKQQDI